MKRLWDQEKLLVMSDFFVSPSVSYLFGELYAIFIKFEIVVCKLFSLEESKICCLGNSLTHYQTTNFRLFQTERVCRRQFQIDENGRKLSRWVENTVEKGEIARYEQFLLFPQCFQKACFPGASKGVIVWEWVNGFVQQPNSS